MTCDFNLGPLVVRPKIREDDENYIGLGQMVKIIWGLCVTSKRNTPDEISFTHSLFLVCPLMDITRVTMEKLFIIVHFWIKNPESRVRKLVCSLS